MKRTKWLAMILAGGKGTRLNQLTNTIVKPALSFGGKYRIIDFALSNCENSGLETIGILTQYQPFVLHSHLRNRRFNNRNGGMRILPPHQRNGGVEWQKGTSHAVFQNIEFIDYHNPEYVLILSADQIYKMDYRLMLQQHVETNADCTIAAVEVPWHEANRFGLIKIDKKTRKIKDFEEKPEKPTSNLASMGIYIFKWPTLREYLIQEEQKDIPTRDFAKGIIPSMMKDGLKLHGYCFNNYWRDVGTVYSYWEANLDLLDREKSLLLTDSEWRINTVEENEPPLYLDERARVHCSIVSDGCEINGTIENSVLCKGVKVGKGTRIQNAVILPHTVIGENVWIENAVIGSQSVINNGVILVSKNPEEQIMVVGHQEAIDPSIVESGSINTVKSIPS